MTLTNRFSLHRRRWLVHLLVLALLIPSLGSSAALPATARQPATPPNTADCRTASEPNDQPGDALDLGSGEACATAENPLGGQDLYTWEVEPADATTRWTITVSAIVDQVTKIEPYLVTYDESGTLTAATKLVSVGGDVNEAVSLPGVMFPTGQQIVLGVATSGPGAYTLDIARNPANPDSTTETEPNDDQSTAMPLSGTFAVTGDQTDSTDTFAWTVTESDANQVWTLSFRKPLGTSSTLQMLTADGTVLTSWTSNAAGLVEIPNFSPGAGTWYFSLPPVSPEQGPYILEITNPQPRAANSETEPNDTAASAIPVTLQDAGTLVQGSLDTRSGSQDRDVYRFTIDSETAGRQLDILTRWESGPTREVCLLDDEENQLRCDDGTKGVALNDLVLAAGDYLIAVSGDIAASNTYIIRFDVTREAGAGFEAEPNDTIATASRLAPDGDRWTGSGRIEPSSNPDYYHFTVTGEPQLWLIDVTGPGVDSVDLIDATGSSIATGHAEDGSARLYDMFLLPGDQHILVAGTADLYQITITPLGPPDPLAELEPNNRIDTSQAIRLTEIRNGRVPSIEDTDFYRFSLQNDSYVRINLSAPDDAQYTMNLSWQGRGITSFNAPEAGTALTWDAWLAAGDYELQIGASVPSLDRYSLEITPLDPFTLPQDLEPNDMATQAQPVTWGQPITGNGSTIMRSGDRDWFLLPAVDSSTQAIFEYPENVRYALFARNDDGSAGESVPVVSGTEAGSDLATLPANTPILLSVDASGDYEIKPQLIDTRGNPVTIDSTPIAMTSEDLAVTIDLEDSTVAAYWEDAQRLTGTVTIDNNGSTTANVTLDAWTGNAAWTVSFDQSSLEIQNGQSVSVPVDVLAAPDARAGQPVTIAVRARIPESFATGITTVTIDRTAPPVHPEPAAPLPEDLLGGLDVAWSSLGAVPDEFASPSTGELFDGLIVSGHGWRASPGELPVDITIDLAGDEPVPVAGFILDPRGDQGIVMDQVRDVEFQLSTNGTDFTTVLAASLTGAPHEQSFVLDNPVDAAFARLRVLSAQSPQASYVVLGEFKVIATPGWSLPGDDGVNLASPLLGGHVVDIQPAQTSGASLQSMLTTDAQNLQLAIKAGEPITWIVGFQWDRAARLDHLTWTDIDGIDPAQQVTPVQVDVSTTSPIGPWEPAGTWNVQDDPVFDFDTPTWARFIRFTFTSPAPADTENPETLYWQLPDGIGIYEQPVTGDYLTILGEWGASRSTAIYETLQPAGIADLDADAGNDRDSATLLPLDTTIANTAWVDQDVDWYRIDAPNDAGVLSFTFTGFPSLDVIPELFDSGGDPVKLTSGDATSGNESEFSATVDPGASYFLRITEPPSNVIFAFDTSGSIGPFVNTVYQGLGEYAADVQKGQEVANFVPFGSQVLLPDWSDEPYLLQSALTNYPRGESSSDADGALLTSMDALAPQAGTKAIILITDNDTSPTPDQLAEEWPQLATVKPSVFSIQIAGGADAAIQQAIMHDWSLVNNGIYQYVQNQGEMDIAFDRAATVLRRPSLYAVRVEASAPPPTPTPEPTATPRPTPTPEPTSTPVPTATSIPTPTPTLVPTAIPLPPGSIFVSELQVEPGARIPAAADLSVAIILDTSGSMLQELDGSTRADIARDALTRLVTDTLPPGTNVSLRTFGDTPDSCETRLVVPQGPLDPSSMAQVIANIPVVNLVRTPIGASLQQVGQDLGTTPGPKIVVLVTDGEETCDGDPAAAIQALIASGIDVRVNIVGFAVDDASLKAQFTEWAQLGNGQYIDAANAGELTAAIAASVQPAFEVIDASGTVIASGQTGGEPVSVPPGTYTVIIHGTREIEFDNVLVESESETWLDPNAP